MKKILAFFLIASLALTAIPMMSFAAELDSMVLYDGHCYGALDNVFLDDSEEFMGGRDGAGREYLAEVDSTITGEHTAITITGWVCFDQPIKGYGYQIDDGDVIMVDDAVIEAGQDVIDAAASVSCDYVTRMKLRMSVEGLLGSHKIIPVVRVEDGDYAMALFTSEIEIYYEGPADPDASPTPEPTATPEGEPLEDSMLFLVFDEEDKYGEIFSNGNGIEVGEFDEEKKCQILEVAESGDPYISISVADAVDEFFGEEVNLDKYKVIQIAAKVDPAVHNGSGQLYFTTSEDPQLSERQNAQYQYAAGEEFQIITVNLTKNKTWTGILQLLRYDVFGTTNADSQVELYYIAFFTTKDYAETFAASYTEKGAEAFPAIATPTPRPTNTPTPVPTATPENTGDDAGNEPTAAPAVTEPPADAGKKSGCGSVVLGGAAIAAMMGAALILLKKKH
ncbi:MAG: hypothetical protein ILO53_03345 [Clostridia bacterium]|nr:hypothetical protein [Clostridia bacterium]